MTKGVVLDQCTESEELFPKVKPNIRPHGSRILVQIRRARTKSRGGIHFIDSTKDTELDNTCVAKVIAVGPLAYKNRNTMEEWPEGAWCKPGDYVFVPKYGGLRWQRPCKATEYYGDKVQFAIFDDLNITGDVEDPFGIETDV